MRYEINLVEYRHNTKTVIAIFFDRDEAFKFANEMVMENWALYPNGVWAYDIRHIAK